MKFEMEIDNYDPMEIDQINQTNIINKNNLQYFLKNMENSIIDLIFEIEKISLKDNIYKNKLNTICGNKLSVIYPQINERIEINNGINSKINEDDLKINENEDDLKINENEDDNYLKINENEDDNYLKINENELLKFIKYNIFKSWIFYIIEFFIIEILILIIKPSNIEFCIILFSSFICIILTFILKMECKKIK